MEWVYVQKPSRGIEVDLGSEWQGFNEALADSVSSMAPGPSRRRSLSTYWIDRTLRGLNDTVDGGVLTSGNATELVVHGDAIVARSLYEHFDDEHMDRESFVEILEAWRARIENARSSAPR